MPITKTPITGFTIPPPPPGDFDWFEFDEDSSNLDNVLNFLGQLPGKLRIFFELPYFNDVFSQLETEGFNRSLFFQALDEASQVLYANLRLVYERLGNENENIREIFNRQYTQTLIQIGFTGTSIRLKVYLLNRFGRKARDAARRVGAFLKRPLVNTIHGFLGLLNSIMGSLTSLVPGLEAVMEIKDSAEAASQLATAEVEG